MPAVKDPANKAKKRRFRHVVNRLHARPRPVKAKPLTIEEMGLTDEDIELMNAVSLASARALVNAAENPAQ